jgi:hypothetical protein
MSEDSNPEIKKIEIREDTLKNLNSLRKWTMFLAVSGFIFLGLIITLGLITGTFLTAFKYTGKTTGIPDFLVMAAFIASAFIIFFPVLFLFRFSKHTIAAVSALNNDEMNRAIKYLKRFFAYFGIMLIIIIILYLVSLVLAGTSVFVKGIL